ncbi:unnamed protein product [Sphagnum compactum]
MEISSKHVTTQDSQGCLCACRWVTALFSNPVYRWGKGYCGALGHGDESDQSFAQQVVGLKSVRAVQVIPSSSPFPGY